MHTPPPALQVTRALHTASGARYAHKRAADASKQEWLDGEARAHADIAPHANVVSLLAVVGDAARPVQALLLEEAPEDDLMSWLVYGKHVAPPLDFDGTLAACEAILAGLAHVHAAGYAHLDLKVRARGRLVCSCSEAL